MGLTGRPDLATAARHRAQRARRGVRPRLPQAALHRFQKALGHLPKGIRILPRQELPDGLVLHERRMDRIEMVVLHQAGGGREGEQSSVAAISKPPL